MANENVRRIVTAAESVRQAALQQVYSVHTFAPSRRIQDGQQVNLVLSRSIDWHKIGSEEGQMIRKVKGGYKVLSEKKKKNLGGPYKTKAEAEKRLRQVEFFKHHKG